MKKKEEKGKAKARNEEIGTNERAVAHPPISAASSAAHIPCPHSPASSLDALHKNEIKSRAFLRQTGQCQWLA